MFGLFHNARKAGRYYLVKGDGPRYGDWKGLEKDMAIVNWNSATDKRSDSLRHFAGLRHRQILAGYYDGPMGAIRGWLADAGGINGIIGVMYTMWRKQYGDLERFAAELKKRPTTDWIGTFGFHRSPHSADARGAATDQRFGL